MILEEQTISSDRIYNGKNINLRIDTVETKDKGYQKREIVEHGGAVAVVAIDDDSKIVLIKQFRKAVEGVIWEIPAGKLEKGESPKDCAIRELKEETGYVASDIKFINKFYTSPGYSTQTVYTFLARGLKKEEPQLEQGENIQTYLVDFDEAYNMVIKNEIQDAKTNIGILLSRNFFD